MYPHVNPDHYSLPNESGARLRCVIVVMRHHKRTPDNLHLSERTLNPITGWNCSSIIPHSHTLAGRLKYSPQQGHLFPTLLQIAYGRVRATLVSLPVRGLTMP
ncbi:hypothetical protein M404DRAFT_1001193 [Pisolithus tinctorius Marx 270]|uniref:Uncharacterized protein n=1 Tax=Pisolithus tinctorius Marx 270 TaxID=870435 RepID=A0A0C3K2E2_PISTI|nr:hypothetical protein M404DRAFT_1001193 [Pisolithus tinctorius Marx 270]